MHGQTSQYRGAIYNRRFSQTAVLASLRYEYPLQTRSPGSPLILPSVFIPTKGSQFFGVSAHFTNLFWFNQAQPLRNLILKACLQA
jgi:hypothetical protein